MKQKNIEKDHGKTLFDSLIIMILLFLVLWYFNI